MDGRLKPNLKIFFVMTVAVMTIYSFYFNSYGANASLMMDFYSIDGAGQGFILTMQSVSGIAMGILYALIGERLNKIYVIGIGGLLISLACLFLGFAPPYVILILLVLVAGVGITSVDIMINGLVADTYPERKTTLLPLVHAFYGVGCVVAPLLISVIVRAEDPSSFRLPFLMVGIAGVIVCLVYSLAGKTALKDTPYANMEVMKKRAKENPAEVFKKAKAWLFLIAGTLYFCSQIGMASWMPTFYLQNTDMGFEMSGIMITLFFAGALVMRFLGPLFLKKMTARTLYVVFGIIAGIIMVFSFLAQDYTLQIILTVAGGFMSGSNVVALVLMCNEAFPGRSASASAIVVLAVNIGTMISPLILGSIAEVAGFFIPMIIASVALIASSVLIFFGTRKTARVAGT